MENWKNLIKKKEGELVFALAAAYATAANSQPNSGFGEAVVLFEDGYISQYTLGQNETLAAVFEGRGVEIGRIPWFDPMEYMGEGEDQSNLELYRQDFVAENAWEWATEQVKDVIRYLDSGYSGY